MYTKIFNRFHDAGFHLFKTRYNNKWAYYAVEYKYIKNNVPDMMQAKFVSGSMEGCSMSIIIN